MNPSKENKKNSLSLKPNSQNSTWLLRCTYATDSNMNIGNDGERYKKNSRGKPASALSWPQAIVAGSNPAWPTCFDAPKVDCSTRNLFNL